MAPARFFTSADASHPAAAISRKELCEREVDEARPWARRHALEASGYQVLPARRVGKRRAGR